MSRVIAVVDDLFFAARITETAKQTGAELATCRAADVVFDKLRAAKPALLLLDLNAASADPVELVRRLKSDPELGAIPVVAFFSHVQVDLQRAALAAGCDQVLPRSKFTASLPDLLRGAASA